MTDSIKCLTEVSHKTSNAQKVFHPNLRIPTGNRPSHSCNFSVTDKKVYVLTKSRGSRGLYMYTAGVLLSRQHTYNHVDYLLRNYNM